MIFAARFTAHSYIQLGGGVTRAPACVLRVKVRLGAAQEVRFEDVSAATVWEEATLVQVHLLAGRLEVQSHWREGHKELQSVKKSCFLIKYVWNSSSSSTDPSGSRSSTFPEDHSWMIAGAGRRGRSGSAACCCVAQKASLQKKKQKKTRMLEADGSIHQAAWKTRSQSRGNYSPRCTWVFDEFECLAFGEGRQFARRYFRCVFKASEGDAPAVHDQIRQLGAELSTDLRTETRQKTERLTRTSSVQASQAQLLLNPPSRGQIWACSCCRSPVLLRCWRRSWRSSRSCSADRGEASPSSPSPECATWAPAGNVCGAKLKLEILVSASVRDHYQLLP